MIIEDVATQKAAFDLEAVRAQFPALSLEIHGKPLAYLDNAASAHKPLAMLEMEERAYREFYSNVHRGVHTLSQRATEEYEIARAKVRRFLNAERDEEIVFVRGTTEAINLVARSFAVPRLEPGDEVLITAMEHHSNIVPWQMICQETGALLQVAPIDEHGDVILSEFEALLSERTKMVAFVHISNALGTINPVEQMTAMAQERGIPVLIDGAQAAPHKKLDVRAIGADFYAFSGHKLFGPTGIGVLYGRYDLLRQMPPYQGGGEMIKTVTFSGTEYADPPARFEAGTPNIVGAIALGAAIDFVQSLDHHAVAAHEESLLAYAIERVSTIPGLRLIGTAKQQASLITFVIDDVHPHDVGQYLDQQGIAVRVGHHCAQPVMQLFDVPATTRASFCFYNTHEEIDRLVDGLQNVREFFA